MKLPHKNIESKESGEERVGSAQSISTSNLHMKHEEHKSLDQIIS